MSTVLQERLTGGRGTTWVRPAVQHPPHSRTSASPWSPAGPSGTSASCCRSPSSMEKRSGRTSGSPPWRHPVWGLPVWWRTAQFWKQRVAIAGALVREVPIPILDHALSAVDMEIDAAIRRGLREREHVATTFIVAHAGEAVDFVRPRGSGGTGYLRARRSDKLR